MEELYQVILEMKNDLNDRFTAMNSQLSQMEQKITSNIKSHVDKRFEEMNIDLNVIKRRVENQEKRLYILEKNSVQRNLVFFGINETEKSYFDLQEIILEFVRNQLKVELQEIEIQSVRRLGKKGHRSRPISVAFTTLGTKIKILKNKKYLTGTDYYIKEEFPANILKIREELKLEQKRELEQGKIAFIKYDKLIIKDKEPSTHKRQLSTSPLKNTPTASESSLNTHSTHKKQFTQTSKKHKTNTNTLHSFLKRYEDA